MAYGVLPHAIILPVHIVPSVAHYTLVICLRNGDKLFVMLTRFGAKFLIQNCHNNQKLLQNKTSGFPAPNLEDVLLNSS